jgi:sugar phosphate isomerase/epimerase
MQLSCLPVSFFSDIIEGRMTIFQWAQMCAGMGLDALDLSILFLSDRSLQAAADARQQVESAGMRVAMLTTYPDFTHPDPAQRKRELELEQHAVALAAELGASLVRVTAGQAHPETSRRNGIAWAVEGLARLVETTSHTGVRLVYENHSKPGAWTFTDFSQPPEIFLAIFHQTASANLGINFDLGNATAFAQDPVELLQQVIHRVVSIHASDTAARGRLQHVLLGTGATPYPELFACLRRHGWDGWICIEEASYQGQPGVQAAVDYVRRTWEETSNA